MKLSRKVIELFIEILADSASDLSLFTLPTNGVYLLGGISVAIEPFIKQSKIFMENYFDKDFSFLLKSFSNIFNKELKYWNDRSCRSSKKNLRRAIKYDKIFWKNKKLKKILIFNFIILIKFIQKINKPHLFKIMIGDWAQSTIPIEYIIIIIILFI